MFPTANLLHAVTPEYVAKKRIEGKCVVWRCRRLRRKEGTRCNTCDSRLHRLRHPEHYAYVNVKKSAQKRDVGFELTFLEFKQFISGTEYLAKKGTEPRSLTIDRIKTDQPYRVGNLRIMSHADNSSHKYEEKSDPSAPADF